MCNLNTELFKELENDCFKDFDYQNIFNIIYIDWMYITNIFLEISLFISEIYNQYICPIIEPFIETHINPLIYGDLNKLYPNIDSLIYNISYNNNTNLVIDMTDYYNEIYLTKIRENRGKSDLITYEEMLIRYYTHNEDYDNLMKMEDISACYITISYNNKTHIKNGLMEYINVHLIH